MKETAGGAATGKTVQLDRGVVKQMIALYQAVQLARETYTGSGGSYKNQMDLVSASADARNVKAAFKNAAEAIGIDL